MGYSSEYVKKLKRFNAYSVIHVPYWYEANNAADVQVVDLDFFRQLEKFRAVDDEIASPVIQTWLRHTDYLAPEFSFLSLTSDRVSTADKKKIAGSILAFPRPQQLPPAPTRPLVQITSSTKLHQLAKSERAYLPFLLLNVSEEFLHDDPSKWASDPDFQRLKGFVQNYRLVNDVAEHFVQLATDFNEKITRNEEQRQFLYHTVENERRNNSDLRIKSLQPSSPSSNEQQGQHSFSLRERLP